MMQAVYVSGTASDNASLAKLLGEVALHASSLCPFRVRSVITPIAPTRSNALRLDFANQVHPVPHMLVSFFLTFTVLACIFCVQRRFLRSIGWHLVVPAGREFQRNFCFHNLLFFFGSQSMKPTDIALCSLLPTAGKASPRTSVRNSLTGR